MTHPEDLAPIGRELRKLVSGEVRTSDHTVRLLRRDGGTIWITANASPVQNASGSPLYFLVYIRDVTERKTLEEQLRQAQKMEAVGRLAGGVAHDFNNLLTAIIGNAELLMREIAPEDPRATRPARRSVRPAHRAATLTRQLLAFSRKQVLQPQVVDLNGVVTDLSTMLRRLIGEHVQLRLELRARPGEGPGGSRPARAGDHQPGGQRAATRCRAGGTLTIDTANVDAADVPDDARVHPADGPAGRSERARRRGGDGPSDAGPPLRALLHDQGAGPRHRAGPRHGVWDRPAERRAHQGQQPAAPREHLHGVSPRVEGPGERFEELPGWIDQPQAAGTVLVVEDELAVRRLASRVLRARGYRVLEASDGGDALRLVDRHGGPLDLVLTDIIMPGLSGPALVERLLPGAPDLKVLYITGYSEEAIRQHGLLPAGGALLEKPFTAHQLAERVHAALDRTET